jgi:hypothetical protein
VRTHRGAIQQGAGLASRCRGTGAAMALLLSALVGLVIPVQGVA